ncbi:potassium-transporting ATPase subunit KdpB [Macrococcoides canis]|uniref:potassium-transporting ATPase subunit KdpB n=1 Tax=Macrococcoides canis TaxID=1855823 RepID=UPI0020B80CBC|nr:potassium-transporting ATPase subunit KdpB [Macrococcus canis]UTH00284.1 potassium-transporting ATPase subunit KdpB [Macrococcus canis]
MKVISRDLLFDALKDALLKFNPKSLYRNPVMFVLLVTFLVTLIGGFIPQLFSMEQPDAYHWSVCVILFFTILFANFAESIAEGRGKAEAKHLRSKKKEMKARLITPSGEKIVSSDTLKSGDIVIVSQGEVIPNDGEIIEGTALVDESAITGESAPVTKESGGDFTSVTGGTTVVSDTLKIKITATAGESFLDKMIALVEGAARQKTPNELALSTILTSLTLIFLIVMITLVPLAEYLDLKLSIISIIALFVCLIPTTIGALLSAIGIAGMDRVTRFNVIAKSGKAVEACGDVDIMILDKTGTITYGNRMAHAFIPLKADDEALLNEAIYYSSFNDETPEGRSIIQFLNKNSNKKCTICGYEEIPFTAQTRMSGIKKEDTFYVKGAVDAIIKKAAAYHFEVPKNLITITDDIANEGGTPLAVMTHQGIIGVIHLKDTVKSGLPERFKALRKLGIETVMCTGDNPLTAASIAKEAGVDRFVAECKPEDKINVIKDAQKLGKVVAMTGDGTNDAPALAVANVGVAMNSGTSAAKEASNMIDLDSDPTKLIEIVEIGKQLLITRGALTTFSITNDVAKYFAIIPALFTGLIPGIEAMNIMHLGSAQSAILSALIFNAIIIPLLIPVALKGVNFKSQSQQMILFKNMMIFGLGGLVAPFIGIKLIDLFINLF